MEFIPEWVLNLFVLTLGLVVGSFTNVLVARMPRGISISHPPSRCPLCLTAVRWRDNVPVLSYLLLRGRCRGCKAPISIRYPLIEVLSALLYLALKLRFGLSWLLLARYFPFATLCLTITFIDLEHRIIPDKLSLPGIVLGLATSWWVADLGFLHAALGAAAGFGGFYLVAVLYEKYSGKSGLGGGDVKLLAMMGAFLGTWGVLATVLISSVVGSVIGVGWALATRQRNIMSSAIPYGPFLVIGGLYYSLLGETLWRLFMIPT